MKTLVFFLEEPSAMEMLKGVLPRLLPSNFPVDYVVFEGKQDLEKRMPRRLNSWLKPDCLFVVMRDQDSGNCKEIKTNLVKLAASAKPRTLLVRIACRELESFYLGDLRAVSEAIGPHGLDKKQQNKKFRSPDGLANPAEELKKIAPTYQKISGSREIGKALDLYKNQSDSFNALISGITNLVEG